MQILISLAVLAPQAAEASGTVDVVLETSMGNIEIELNTEKAPQSAGSFLKILDAGLYDKTAFYRVVRPDNDNGDPAITVIQGGLDLTAPLPDGVADPVSHESTQQTGLKHSDGTLSLARTEVGSASGAAFFICIGENPSLDYGGKRNADGQGFAAFGKVTRGMEVVKQINALRETQDAGHPYLANQVLAKPMAIEKAYRVAD